MKRQAFLSMAVVLGLGLMLGLLVAGTPPSPASLAAPAGTPLFVKPDGLYSGNCDSWANACALQHALIIVASSGDQIWVAAGTYYPGSARWDTFQLVSGVAVYGGFAGTEDVDEFDQRNPDPATNGTILSGDIGTPDHSGDNSYHVVTGSLLTETAALDGFTVTGGYAKDTPEWDHRFGAGLFAYAGELRLENLRFEANEAEEWGGALYLNSSNVTLMYVTFSGNTAKRGGGMYNNHSTALLTNCTFSGNQAPEHGGGMYNDNSAPTLTNCEFRDNEADSDSSGGGYGGGMCNEPNSSPVLSATHFISNTANYGGGMFNRDGSSPELTDVTFSGNTATADGGGMHNEVNSSPTLTGCEFSGNNAPVSGGGMVNRYGSSPELTDVTFSGNTATADGGGMLNEVNSSPMLTNVTFSANQAAGDGGGMYNYDHSSPRLTDCEFTYNVADSDSPGGHGGGMYNELNSSPVLSATHFYTNTARHGGGLYNYEYSSPTLNGCTFSGNTAAIGGGMRNSENSNPTLTVCELSGNQAANDGGGIFNDYSTSTLIGVTFSGNTAGSTGGGIYNFYSGSTLTGVTFSGNTAGAGGGMYTYDSGLVLTGCEFGNNTATGGGGGMVSVGGSLTLSDTKFISNTAGWHGGGMWDSGSSPTLTNCQFAYNVADSDGDGDGDGGGMWSEGNSSPVLSGTHFYTNTANYGGGLHNGDGSNPTLTDVTLSGNTANYGGGMHNNDSSPAATHVTIISNTADYGGGMYNTGSPTVSHVTLISNTATYGGGMYNDGGAPTLNAITLTLNTAQNGGGIYNSASSPTLTDVAVSANHAQDGGGMYNFTSSPVLTGTYIFGNTAGSNGGGMYNEDGSSPDLFHSLLSGNEAGGSGGGMYNDNSSPRLLLSTLSANGAAVQGGGLANVNGSSPVVANSILWGTAASPGAQIWSDVTSTPVVSHSLVQGGHLGPGNIDADPHFAYADGPDGVYGTLDDDLHLTCDSPALDGGDNSLVPSGVTTDLDGLPRFRGLEEREPLVEKPPVDLGPYEEQDYGQWVSEGWTILGEGQAYRTGFHVDPTKTITATIDVYDDTYFIDAADLYSQALTCAPVEVRRTEAGTGLLDATWELATGEMLLGNEAMVQTMDMRFTAQYPELADQIDKLVEARDHFSRAVDGYLEVLSGDYYTVAMDLQSSQIATRTSPLDGSEAPYLDVQRLAEASAKKAGAYVELAERQFRLYTTAGKAQAEATLREGFDQAAAELALLDHLAEGWAEPTTAHLNAYQALTQDLADMGRLFGYLKEGKNPFGYAEQYVPFMPIELGVEFPAPNFVRWYDRAMTDGWVGYDKAVQEYAKLEGQERLLDNDDTELGTAMGLLDGKYRDRLVEICGPKDEPEDGTEPDLAGCHQNPGGTMKDQFYAIEQAEIRVQKVRLQMEDQLALIRIEQQRAAQVAGIHRATAVMYTETGEELASLARQEVELDQAGGWCDMLGGIFESAWSGASTGMSFGPEGAIIGGAVAGLLKIGSIIEAEATAPEMDLADIEERREEIKAYQEAQVEYGEAEIEDAKSEALIKQYMLEYAELKLDLAIAINQFQQELARLEGMKAQVEYLLARWNEARRTATELYYDPGARVVRDIYAEEARHYFEAALESAYLAGRALDYEMAEQWPGEGDVYGLVAPKGTTNDLGGHLEVMSTTYETWFERSPQQRDTAIKLSEAMGFVDSWEMVGGVPQWVTAEEKFNRYVSDPGNWVALDDNPATPPSLRLVFQTTLFADPPQFFSNNVYNDKIRFFYIVLRGDESALDPEDNDTYVRLGQEGTSFIRNEDARPPEGNDSFREYNLEPTRNYDTKAIYNRKPDWDGDESYRSYGLYWRSVACTKWVLTIDRENDPANGDLEDLAALDEIEVHIAERNFSLEALRAAEGEAKATLPETGPATPSPRGDSGLVAAGGDAPRVGLASLTTDAEAARRFAGTVIPEQPPRLPPLELALHLEEAGGSVTGAIEAEGLLGYPILDTEIGFGPVFHGTVQDGKYVLTSTPFIGSGGVQRQLLLTTTKTTTSTISGEYAEKILGLIPQDLEVQGVFTLTRSLDEPLASFSAKPSTGPAPLVVGFLDFSLGDPTSWAWDFGDGAASSEISPTHTYEQPGFYTVTLTVSNLFGSHTLKETELIWVTGPAAPLAYFEAHPTYGTVPLEVTFTDGSAGGPTSWAWDFGDGGTSTDQNPTHIYSVAGTYTVILTATNDYGSHTRTMNDYITVTEPQAPEAHFSANPTSGFAPLTVAFTDQSTNGPTAWDWDFGDGGSSSAQDPEHTYQAGGTFTVTLNVSNAIGSDTLILPSLITVEEAERIYLPLVLRNTP